MSSLKDIINKIMAIPKSRDEFVDYCLRRLGAPVIEINVSEEQVYDRIDDSLQFFRDYHFDATEKVYYKHRVTAGDRPGAVKEIRILDGGTLYSNNDTISISGGNSADVNLTTDSNGTITSFTINDVGNSYSNTSVVTINTSTGSGANLSLIVGDGSITMPENIMGAVRVFPIGDPAVRSDDMFNIRYQIALNDLYTLTSVSMIPYYMAMQHLGLIQEMLVGQQPIRYNRHTNKLFIDMKWSSVIDDEYLLIEAYEVVDPDVYTDIWGDRWLQRYATAQIKRQWGENITKFIGQQMPGGVQFNGERILNDAQQEIKDLEDQMLFSYSLPPEDFVG